MRLLPAHTRCRWILGQTSKSHLVTESALRDVIHRSSTNTQKLLAIMLVDPERAKKGVEIIQIAQRIGLPEARSWNVSTLLRGAKGMAIRLPDGWLLTWTGRTTVADKFDLKGGAEHPVPQISTLRKHLAGLSAP